MAKINSESVMTDLKARFGDKVEKDLERFKLDSESLSDSDVIGKSYAASNIGMTNEDDLEGLAEEEYPYGEIKFWTKLAQKAEKLCAKLKLPLTNRNVMMLLWHDKFWGRKSQTPG